MLSYIVRRLLLMIPTVLGITLLVFLVMGLSPGGVAGALMSTQGTMRPEEAQARRAEFDRRYGLDKPLMVQYGRWLNRVSPIGFRTYDDDHPEVIKAERAAAEAAKNLPPGSPKPKPDVRAGDVDLSRPALKWPDLGRSILRNDSVGNIIGRTLPITLLLNLLTIPIIYAVSVTTGMYAARHRGKSFDVVSGTSMLALWSIPTMWTGVMMIGFLASKDYLAWFPTSGLHDIQADQMAFLPRWGAGGFERGWLLDFAWHLVLPVACLTYGGFAFLSKLMRASVLENLLADFARTARAKGLSDKVVLYRHVLRNSLLPLITMTAAMIPSLIGGSVVVEYIFSIPGMGDLVIRAIKQSDRDIVLSVTLVVGVVTVLSQLLGDILYAVADPRITYD